MNLELWTEKRSEGQSVMERLFDRLDGMYPGMWSSKFADDDAVKNWETAWAEAFYEESITPEEIGFALRELRRRGGFPPSLPEFISVCRKPIDYDKAFFEAVHQMGVRRRPRPSVSNGEIVYIQGQDVWSNPAIYWAAVAMGKDLDVEFHKVRNRWHFELDLVLSSPVKPVPKNTNLISEKVPSKIPSQEEIDTFKGLLASLFDEEKPDTKPLTPAQIADNERLARLRNEFKNNNSQQV